MVKLCRLGFGALSEANALTMRTIVDMLVSSIRDRDIMEKALKTEKLHTRNAEKVVAYITLVAVLERIIKHTINKLCDEAVEKALEEEKAFKYLVELSERSAEALRAYRAFSKAVKFLSEFMKE